jgi:1,4-dihydroxy-6-naphthoate synthase
MISNPIKIAHSPDSDDAFMFYALKHKKIDTKGYQFEFSADEIAVLNQKALNKDPDLDVIAVSFHTLAYIQDSYTYLKSGASMAGTDYGPRLVSKDLSNLIRQCIIAVPGRLTSAYLVLRLYEAVINGAVWDSNLKIKLEQGFFTPRFCSYNEVFELLDSSQVSAGLLIHEAQLRYQELGYKLIVDLGAWWFQNTGLKMPLGTNAIKKSLGADFINEFDEMLKQSILWGLDNLDEALGYSRKFANNNLDDKSAHKYIEMYVNESTIQLTDDDKKSVELLLRLVDN